MAKQTLAVRYSDAAQIQVFRLNNGTFEAFGNPFTPSGGMVLPGSTAAKTNLAIQFGGDFYVNANGDIRKFNPSTQDWDAETIPATGTTTNEAWGGLFVGRGPTGAPRLCAPYMANTTTRTLFLDPGGSWTLGNAGPSFFPQNRGYGGNAMKFNNSIYLQQNSSIATYNISTDNWVTDTVLGNGVKYVSFVRAKGRGFMIGHTAGANQFMNLYEVVAGNFALIVSGATTTPTLPQLSTTGQPLVSSPFHDAFYDEGLGRIVILAWEDRGATATRGLKCVSIDPDTGDVTDHTSLVPAAIRYGNLGVSISNDGRVHVQVDNESTPAAPIVTAWVSFNDGAYEGLQWNGSGSPMTTVGSGGDRGIALSRFDQGGGEYIYEGSTTANPAHHIEEIQGRVAIPGGTRVFLRGYTFDETGGTPVVPDETAALFWNKAQGPGPRNLGTLDAVALASGPGTAPTLNANKIDDMTLDGVSVYSADWLAVGDGVANGEKHQLQPRLEL